MQLRPIKEAELYAIFKEMFSRVGQDYSGLKAKGFLDNQEWYLRYQWTVDEQADFAKWLSDYFKQNKIVSKRKYRNQDPGLYLAGKFLLDYGWKISV
jgi:hypothetical protein